MSTDQQCEAREASPSRGKTNPSASARRYETRMARYGQRTGHASFATSDEGGDGVTTSAHLMPLRHEMEEADISGLRRVVPRGRTKIPMSEIVESRAHVGDVQERARKRNQSEPDSSTSRRAARP